MPTTKKTGDNMANYRRARQSGGTFFFTLVTHRRQPILASEENVHLLRNAVSRVKQARPFQINAIVILPDHLHAIWTLPPNDYDFSIRWRLIKYRFSLSCKGATKDRKSLRRKREKGIWQRRFWEHTIRDEKDLHRHMDYIHYNPVKHGFVTRPVDWPYSSFKRFVQRGLYPETWGKNAEPVGLDGMDIE